jgi:hypothetical protein
MSANWRLLALASYGDEHDNHESGRNFDMPNAKQEANRALSLRFENDIADRFIGRRDMLIGLWAGEQLGLPEENCTLYALEVMAAGLLDPAPDRVVDKIAHDFTERGILITRGQIRLQLSKNHRICRNEARGSGPDELL